MGANGRLGRKLVETIFAQGKEVRAAARQNLLELPNGLENVVLGPLNGDTDWDLALTDVDTVIYCSSLTWLPPNVDQSAYMTANVDAIKRLAESACRFGVNRVVYVSSITVNGKHNINGPFRSDDVPKPESAYAHSKFEAEEILKASNIPEVVIVRSPRINWEESTGNVAMMEKLISLGVPLPFGRLTKNKRDSVSSYNIIDALIACSQRLEAAGETFLVSDQNPLSTRDLVLNIGQKLGRRSILFPFPFFLLKLLILIMPKKFLGRLSPRDLFNELTRNLEVDISRIRDVIGWIPLRNGNFERYKLDSKNQQNLIKKDIL